jgi:Spy/CpxP family protein refolding chaperone
MASRTSLILIRFLAALFLLSSSFSNSPAFCQEEHLAVNWSKLNLTDQQSKKIEELEQQWRHDYAQLKPAIAEDQTRIAKLLGEHDSDPVEIMSVQASLARKREQLSALAMSNYLKKREVLSENQRRTLEIMMRQAISEHEQNYMGGTLTQGGPDHIQGLMQRVRNAWTGQGEH